MEEIQVRAASGSYPVFVGEGALDEKVPRLLEGRAPGQAVVVSHSELIALHGERIARALRRGGQEEWEERMFLFPPGEEHKNLAVLEKLYFHLLEKGITREGIILAFGGGVVGDLAGFAAATYMRGIDLVQLPTTLMAMVDSSVGGKVGVDMPGAKNAVGAFRQPLAVISDPEVLATLPARELLSGLAEVAKYGFIYDSSLLSVLKRGMEGWASLAERKRSEVIAACVRHKAAVVERDELDIRGERAMLNYGHTFGHALEAAAGYGALRHGEAVAAGMIMAARVAERSGTAKEEILGLHRELLLPLLRDAPFPEDLRPEEVLAGMRSDKKRARAARFVLLEGLQKPVMVEGLPEEMVGEAVEETLGELGVWAR